MPTSPLPSWPARPSKRPAPRSTGPVAVVSAVLVAGVAVVGVAVAGVAVGGPVVDGSMAGVAEVAGLAEVAGVPGVEVDAFVGAVRAAAIDVSKPSWTSSSRKKGEISHQETTTSGRPSTTTRTTGGTRHASMATRAPAARAVPPNVNSSVRQFWN